MLRPTAKPSKTGASAVYKHKNVLQILTVTCLEKKKKKA